MKTIMEMACEAGFQTGEITYQHGESTYQFARPMGHAGWCLVELEAFAKLVREDEREACERAVEELLPDADRGDCAAAIRARSNT